MHMSGSRFVQTVAPAKNIMLLVRPEPRDLGAKAGLKFWGVRGQGGKGDEAGKETYQAQDSSF